jgi:hypothetical protein
MKLKYFVQLNYTHIFIFILGKYICQKFILIKAQLYRKIQGDKDDVNKPLKGI